MMVNRYSIAANADAIATRFSIDTTASYKPQFNAAPTHLLPVITQGDNKGLSFFYWGAPPQWANKKPLAERIINTKSETIPEKTVLRKKLIDHRCLIPADGFFVWKRIGKKGAIPYRFTLKDKALFAMAGLWEEYENENGDTFHTFNLITTVASESVLPISERMPAILLPEHETDWMNNKSEEKSLLQMLEIFPPQLDHYSVSSLVNNPERNDRTVILPAPPADQYGNLTLFD